MAIRKPWRTFESFLLLPLPGCRPPRSNREALVKERVRDAPADVAQQAGTILSTLMRSERGMPPQRSMPAFFKPAHLTAQILRKHRCHVSYGIPFQSGGWFVDECFQNRNESRS